MLISVFFPSETPAYAFGMEDELDLTVFVKNLGEESYETQFFLTLPSGVTYINIHKVESVSSLTISIKAFYICTYVCMYVCMHLSIYLSIYLYLYYIYLFIYLSIYQFIYLAIYYLSISTFIHIYLSIYLSSYSPIH